MYNNPLGKKPSPRSSHRKIITFISKLCRSPAARPSQPPAPSARAACPGVCQRAGARVRVRACAAPGSRGRGGGQARGSCGCINLFNQKTQTHTHTKGGLSADLGGGEEPWPRPARGESRGEGGRGGLGNLKMKDLSTCVSPALFIKNGTYINILRQFSILQG